jgi:tetratricopeptide (TPR) repeat protein
VGVGVASASVETELAFHQGVVAFGEGRLEDARGHFETVLVAEPDDESAIEYIALIDAAEGKSEDSLARLGAAAAADPANLGLQIAYGTALLEAEKTAEAEAVFARVLEADAENADAQLFAGITQYRRRNFEAAIQHLNKAALLDPGLRLEASYYTGLSEAFLGEIDASVGTFANAAQMSATDPLAISAAELSRAIKPTQRRWGVEVMMGVEYDSNPTLVGTAEDSFGSRKEDAVGLFGVRGHYLVYTKKSFDFDLVYNGFLNVHDRNSEFDQQTHVVSGVSTYGIKPFRLGLRYDFANTLLDQSQYRMQHRLTPSVNFDGGRFGVSQLFYQFQYFDYDSSDWTQVRAPSRTLDSDPNGVTHTVGITQYFYLPRPFTYGRLGIAWDEYDTDGSEYDHEGVSVSAGFGAALFWSSRVDFLYRYLHRDYDNVSVWPDNGGRPVTRDDDIHRVSLVWSVPFLSSYELSLHGSLNFNDSDHPVFDADRHLAGIELRYFF